MLILSLGHLSTSELRVRRVFVFLCVDDAGVSHERRDERGDDRGVEARDGKAGGKRCLFQRLVLHRQPKLINVNLIRRLEIRPCELHREKNRVTVLYLTSLQFFYYFSITCAFSIDIVYYYFGLDLTFIYIFLFFFSN